MPYATVNGIRLHYAHQGRRDRASGRGLVEWNGTRLRELGKLRAPALVMVGRDDILTPPVFSRRLAALIPNAKLRVLPGGHAFFMEEVARFNRALLAFLAG